MVKSGFNIFQFLQLWKHQNNGTNCVMIGRWNLDYDNTIQTRKVYWANMDHCGCCDSAKFETTGFDMMTGIENHKLKIQKIQDSKKNTINYNHSDEYLLPYLI